MKIDTLPINFNINDYPDYTQSPEFIEKCKLYYNENKNDNYILKNYVYIVKCRRYYKIGVSNNIKSRINDLQVGNPFKISLYKLYSYHNAFNKEKELHIKYKSKCHTGEWFLLNQEDLKEIDEDFKNVWK